MKVRPNFRQRNVEHEKLSFRKLFSCQGRKNISMGRYFFVNLQFENAERWPGCEAYNSLRRGKYVQHAALMRKGALQT